jgi:hypothetical protein
MTVTGLFCVRSFDVVGERLIHEGVSIGTDPGKLVEHSGRVYLLPYGFGVTHNGKLENSNPSSPAGGEGDYRVRQRTK